MTNLIKICKDPFASLIAKEAWERKWNKQQLAHFLSQTMHESADYSRLEENLNYSASGLLRTWRSRFTTALAKTMARSPQAIANYVYGGRFGNNKLNDGWTYRGRGIIHVTFKANYKKCSIAIFGDDRLVQNPDLLKEPETAVKSAFWYWDLHKLSTISTVAYLTRKINGGTIGLADREKRYFKVLRQLG